MPTDLQREARVRRHAQRLGLMVMKSRARTSASPLFGTYMLVDPTTNTIVASGSADGFGLDLDELERSLSE